MPYIVYILQCADGSYYTGITTDIKRRLKEHNGVLKGGAAYTRSRRPVTLLYSEPFRNRSTATKREYALKQLTHKQKGIIVSMDYHAFVVDEINKAPKKPTGHFNSVSYMGTAHPFLGITNPNKYKIAAAFKKQFPNITFEEMITLLNKLNKGKSFEEKTIGPMMLPRFKKIILRIQPEHIDKWLENLEGWCEIDTLCQSTFPPEFFLNNWNDWKKTLANWSKDKAVAKRRASLVLLCKAAGKNADSRLSALAFENIERLKHEKDILITKAISWLLRSMIETHPKEVAAYLKKNQDSLPKIAIRETRRKLETGRK